MNKSKESRPFAARGAPGSGFGATSSHKPFARDALRGGDKDDKRKPFSKPGDRAGPGATRKGAMGAPSSSKPSVTYNRSSDKPAPSTAADMFADDDSTATQPTKVKKPKVPKPPVDPNEHISQRAFVGGLAQDITSTDVENRFKSFGQLKDVYLAKDVDGNCRGFGYVTIDTTRKDWSKCLALFNGAKWKGHVLKIEEANKDWQTRRQEDLEKQAKLEKKAQDAILKKFKRNPVKHAEDMSLITDKNMDGKRGWKRGRFGRPVITMKLDRMTYDPSHYKNNTEKIVNAIGKPLPLDQLLYQIDENEPIPKGKHLPTEVALAPFLSRMGASVHAPNRESPKTSVDGKKDQAHSRQSEVRLEPQFQLPIDSANGSDDRAMMASILAGIDLSPRALSLDGSDFEDDGHDGYMEDFGALDDTKADDLFGDMDTVQPARTLSKSERESRPEDLFGSDDEDDQTEANRPLLDFLEDGDGDGDDDDDEDMESIEDDEEEQEEEEEEEEDGDQEEEGSDDDDAMDDDTIKAIAQLQESSSASAGGLFDSDDDQANASNNQDTTTKFAEESNATRLKAQESREAELEAARGKQQQLIASTLANMDSKDKKAGHVVFSDSDDYDSEDYEQMEADHAKKLARLNKPAKSIFDSDSGSGDEDDDDTMVSRRKRKGVKEMFASDDEDDETTAGFDKLVEPDLNIKEQFEGPGGKALFKMQTKIGTTDSRFQLTKDFLDDRIREEDDADFVAHQDQLKLDEYTTGGTGAADIVLDEDRQVESNVSAEKMQAMNVLRAMFGDSVVRSKQKDEDSARKAKGGIGFTAGLTVRYDPDAAPSPPPSPPAEAMEEPKASAFESESESESEPEQPVRSVQDEDQSEDALSINEAAEEEEGHKGIKGKPETKDSKPPVKKSVGFSFAFDEDTLNADENEAETKEKSSLFSPAPTNTDTTRKFQVATDLKSLFAPATGGFKMFGGDDDDEEDEDEGKGDDVEDDRQDGSMGEDGRRDEETLMTSYTDGSRTVFVSGAEALNRAPLSHSGSMFFFHFKNPALLRRSNFKTSNKIFMRTDTFDEVTAQWEKTRHSMTQEFKRKHKSASRNKARASKRFKAGAGSGGSGGGGPGDHQA
ncbi:nucleolar protein 8 [Mortierella alpina]|nr:nucleolar protein 8 [Mortierella alpina]